MALGCSALEIAAGAKLLLAPAAHKIAAARGWVGAQHPVLSPLSRRIGEAFSAIQSGAGRIESGDVCGGARGAKAGLARLQATAAEIDAALTALQTEVVAVGRTQDGDGDAGPAEIAYAGLEVGKTLVGQSTESAESAQRGFDAACGSVAGTLALRGRIVRTNDAAGLIELEGGVLVALAERRWKGPVHRGREVVVKGVRFADRTGVARDLVSAPPVIGKLSQVPCLALRIAPLQAFWPYGSGPYILHRPSAYAAPTVLNLEAGVRVGVQELSCPGSSPDGKTHRYFMQIDYAQGANKGTLALDLEAGETPVGLGVGTNAYATITGTIYRSSCKFLANGTDVCDAIVKLSTVAYTVLVRPTGFYAKATYDRTIFAVADTGAPFQWQAAKVTGVQLTGVPASANAAFKALGYTASGCNDANAFSSKPNVQVIDGNECFAVYEDDFSDPGQLFAFDATGANERGGVKWPRVEGKRNGWTFSYSARLPRLVRDALDFCAGSPETFYRLPFDNDTDWRLFNGNFDDPSGKGHGDSGIPPGGVGNNQKYAFDFAHDFNGNGVGEWLQKVRAARGGTVWAIQDGETGNSWAGTVKTDLGFTVVSQSGPSPPGFSGVGNFVVIAHQDGTFGTYWHLYANTISVAPGDTVARGTVLAQSGNTGNSSTPHLHFDAREKWALVYPNPKTEYPGVELRFQDHNHPQGCWLPRVGQVMASNNS